MPEVEALAENEGRHLTQPRADFLHARGHRVEWLELASPRAAECQLYLREERLVV
jgi:hypothetical protein